MSIIRSAYRGGGGEPACMVYTHSNKSKFTCTYLIQYNVSTLDQHKITILCKIIITHDKLTLVQYC